MTPLDVAGLKWRKASRSNASGACVELAQLPTGGVGLRDSKAGDDGPVLVFTKDEIAAFLVGAKGGEFDDLI